MEFGRNGWAMIVGRNDHDVTSPVYINKRGAVRVWQKLEGGWRVTHVEPDGTTRQAEGSSRRVAVEALEPAAA
jgi:hypothetical protein